jgi:hypothetical protein
MYGIGMASWLCAVTPSPLLLLLLLSSNTLNMPLLIVCFFQVEYKFHEIKVCVLFFDKFSNAGYSLVP